jgi:hypothetical protein
MKQRSQALRASAIVAARSAVTVVAAESLLKTMPSQQEI